tara:strand:+ start:1077 stop:1931 length:855 start_codon:yes stop_codon:yes gene_type:complete
MSAKNKIKKLLQQIIVKYRFVIMTDDSFEERLSLKISRVKILFLLIAAICIGFLFSFFIISNTFIKSYIPGMSKEDLENQVVALSIKSDSLIGVLNYQKSYLTNIQNIISGNVISQKDSLEEMESISLDDIDFATSTKESLLRQNVEEEEKGALFFNSNKNNLVLFFTPISGVITERFNVSTLHYGVDVVAKENSRVASVLSGTIVVSDWNPETGHSIGIQHKDGYLSFYKHNSVLLRSVGDYVKGGEHVAIIGDSGEFSSGSHLHFELWQNGKPVNPENFILF